MPAIGTFAAGSTRGFGGLSSISFPQPEYWWRADSGLTTSSWTAVNGGLDFTLVNATSADSVNGLFFNGTSTYGELVNTLASDLDIRHIFIRYDALGIGGNTPAFMHHSVTVASRIYYYLAATTHNWSTREYNAAVTVVWEAGKPKSGTAVDNNITPSYIWYDMGNSLTGPQDRAPYYTEQFRSSANWTKPAGVTEVIVECIGGGGAGGGLVAGTAGSFGGGGGGGGSYARKTLTYGSPQQSIPFVVGGQATGTTGNGANGNDTTWNTNEVVAKGGIGGLGNQSNGGGGSGAPSGSIGDVILNGGNGGNGVSNVGGGGGGGGAGTAEAGNDAIGTAGGAEAREYGGRGGNGSTITGAGGNAGQNATGNFGAGGGGAYRTTGTTTANGGIGGAGVVRVSYPLATSTTGQLWNILQGTYPSRYRFISGFKINIGRKAATNEFFFGYIKEIAFFTTNLTEEEGAKFRDSMMRRWPKLGIL